MNILVACEMSGRVATACRSNGHNAYSCDLMPSRAGSYHFQIDARYLFDLPWDLVIAFPPCIYLTNARCPKLPPDNLDAAGAVLFAQLCAQGGARSAIENPPGRLTRAWRHPDQTVQPWQFGDPWTKRTSLWLKGLPLLMPTAIVAPEYSFTQRHRPHSKQRSIRRSITPPGLAQAMADQWAPVDNPELSTLPQ